MQIIKDLMLDVMTYFRYLIWHKALVYKHGRKLGVPIFQLLIHDWSKFTPTEFVPYMNKFIRHLSDDGSVRAYHKAFLHHVHRNPHHWEHWVVPSKYDGNVAVEMPEKYVLEMIADWNAMAEIYDMGQSEWYINHYEDVILHSATRKRVDDLLDVHPIKF